MQIEGQFQTVCIGANSLFYLEGAMPLWLKLTARSVSGFRRHLEISVHKYFVCDFESDVLPPLVSVECLTCLGSPQSILGKNNSF